MKIEKTINILNKRAKFEYEILEQIEAGIVLTGTEIKALRSSKASITESFCQFIENELFVVNMSIDEYKLGTFYNHIIKRERKLLLHKKELQKFPQSSSPEPHLRKVMINRAERVRIYSSKSS
jgi:SsrA-binding protein